MPGPPVPTPQKAPPALSPGSWVQSPDPQTPGCLLGVAPGCSAPTGPGPRLPENQPHSKSKPPNPHQDLQTPPYLPAMPPTGLRRHAVQSQISPRRPHIHCSRHISALPSQVKGRAPELSQTPQVHPALSPFKLSPNMAGIICPHGAHLTSPPPTQHLRFSSHYS